MRYFSKTRIVMRIVLQAAAHIATPAAAASFDGQWNVQIASTSSVCGSGASVSIGINNGRPAGGYYPTFSEYSASVTCSIQVT